jgi:tetratricopeptide (TPR) repeat protein
MPDYFDLGTYTRPVTASSAEAQTWFTRGLVWAYGFNHGEAARCFERAVEADPDFALAHWGVAYAVGPNYNMPWDGYRPEDLAEAVTRARAALAAASQHTAGAAPVEQALISALAARYPAAEPDGDLQAWSVAYADAMGGVYRQYPSDLDVAALYADALMNLTPWQLWDQQTGEPAQESGTVGAREVLERALAGEDGRQHPGILHFYVHLMEMSPRPEDALPAGELLRHLVPDAGHLIHMPTHLDVLCGDYRRVVAGNTDAVVADEKYRAVAGEMNQYTLYRVHNHHFRIYGAMFLGQAQTALQAADDLAAAIPDALLRKESPPMADWLEGFVPMKLHVLIRFGRWADIIATPLPGEPELYCYTLALTHYAKGIACAATGQTGRALEHRQEFRRAAELVPATRTIFNNTCPDILKIAAAMLDGEIAYRQQDYGTAFAHLRRAIDLDDHLPYDEPWGWMQPTRHAYGALLLEQGRVEEAAAVYRADLGFDHTLARACQHPANVWSLHGYHECLTRLGRGEEATIIGQQLKVAAAYTDVPVTASCACRLSAATTSA